MTLFVYSTGLSLQHDISSSILSYSVIDSYTGCKSFEENLSSFSSPELFRGSDYFGEKIISILNYSTLKIVPLSTNPVMNNFCSEGVLVFLTKTSLSLFGFGVGHVTCFGTRISVNKTYANLWNMLTWSDLSSYTFAIMRRIYLN